MKLVVAVLVAMEIAGGMLTVGRLGTSAGGVLVSVNDRTCTAITATLALVELYN